VIAVEASTRVIDDHLVEVTLTAIVAWGSFVRAESVHASGVLACVAAGVVHSNIGAKIGMSPTTRVAVLAFWEFMAFFANTLVFLLIGLELDIADLANALVPITLVFASVLVARGSVVAMGWAASRSSSGVEPIPSKWIPVLVWGGLRGSLSMVLVIGLPYDLETRGLLVALVFGVTATTLLVQGLTMKPILARLGLSRSSTAGPIERAWAERMIASRALGEIERWVDDGRLAPTDAERRGRGAAARQRNRAQTGSHRERRRVMQAAATRCLGIERRISDAQLPSR